MRLPPRLSDVSSAGFPGERLESFVTWQVRIDGIYLTFRRTRLQVGPLGFPIRARGPLDKARGKDKILQGREIGAFDAADAGPNSWL
jgi:hypothetical protein